jgi:hypothetical protein
MERGSIMLEPAEFPVILSPNLGCPEIVCADDLRAGKTVRLIVASQGDGLARPPDKMLAKMVYLRPCDGKPPAEIPLQIKEPAQEITDWNLLSDFPNLEATREMISDELHYNILGDPTRYWRVEGVIDLGNKGANNFPRLFDLVLKDKSSGREKVNYHAVQIVEQFPEQVKFIHLTDLHLSQRNDEILPEVLTARSEMTRRCIENRYVNFNENLRAFIKRANEMKHLDFVVITGDLVDYAFPGWDAGRDESENNWKTFVNIVTGGGKEKDRGNLGFRVPIFTSTGNHDWRLYPYDPKIHCEIFGLDKRIIKGYKYKYFDSREYPDSEEAKTARQFLSEASRQLRTGALGQGAITRVKTRAGQMMASRVTPWLLPAVTAAGLGGAGLITAQRVLWVILLGAEVPIMLTKGLVGRQARRLADFLVSNPLLAEAKALHYYLRHINPYFDYAFRYGRHSFVVMDTGTDVLTGDLLDGKGVRKLKHMSIEDNILGGSPDSMAFDSRQKYYNWSQIVWLERVLSTCNQQDYDGRTFVFLHAPPFNPPRRPMCRRIELRESERKDPYSSWIPECDCNLTFGTVNHYLRQFLCLCMGYREGELSTEVIKPTVRKVDIVFSGHAHTNIEFRVAEQWSQQESEHVIRVYCDAYSAAPPDKRDAQWPPTPLIVQTGACGPGGARAKNQTAGRGARHAGTENQTGARGARDAGTKNQTVTCGEGDPGTENQTGAREPESSHRVQKPPYYRLVRIDRQGRISDFSALDGEGKAVGWSDPIQRRTLGERLKSVRKTWRRWFGCQWCSVQKRWMRCTCG